MEINEFHKFPSKALINFKNMNEEIIINRVANSGLVSINLADYLDNDFKGIDLKPFLFQELILKEKDFRTALEVIDWQQYENDIVTIFCSNDSIIPAWAYMLVATKLCGIAKDIYQEQPGLLSTQLLLQRIQNIETAQYIDQRIVVKGCGDNRINEKAYVALTQKLVPVVKSLMYGEPCSTVPVYKKKKI